MIIQSSYFVKYLIYAVLLYMFPNLHSAAEKDKGFFETKFSTSSEAIDSLNQQMRDMSLRLDAAKEEITSSKSLHYSIYDL